MFIIIFFFGGGGGGGGGRGVDGGGGAFVSLYQAVAQRLAEKGEKKIAKICTSANTVYLAVALL